MDVRAALSAEVGTSPVQRTSAELLITLAIALAYVVEMIEPTKGSGKAL